MKKRGEQTGTLPGYLSEAKARPLRNRLFRNRRKLSVSEEADMLLTGVSRKDLRKMTPKRLKELADWFDGDLLGC
ncbi:MAG: hypothetical protein AAB542_04410 [Patescibacteria group bacterium]